MVERSLPDVIAALNNLARTGWMLRGVPNTIAEPVSSHSFNASIIAFELAVWVAERGVTVSPEKAAAIALFHDVGESIIGDIPKTAGISDAKREAEARAVQSLPLSEAAKSLIREFEDSRSSEAIIARIAELAATLLVGLRYKSLGYSVDEIIESSTSTIRTIIGKVEWGEAAKEFFAVRLGVDL